MFPNGVTSYESELDKVFPFNKICPVYDVYGNRLIKFPKCYIRWTDTAEGYIDGFDVAAEKISATATVRQVKKYFLNPLAYAVKCAILFGRKEK